MSNWATINGLTADTTKALNTIKAKYNDSLPFKNHILALNSDVTAFRGRVGVDWWAAWVGVDNNYRHAYVETRTIPSPFRAGQTYTGTLYDVFNFAYKSCQGGGDKQVGDYISLFRGFKNDAEQYAANIVDAQSKLIDAKNKIQEYVDKCNGSMTTTRNYLKLINEKKTFADKNYKIAKDQMDYIDTLTKKMKVLPRRVFKKHDDWFKEIEKDYKTFNEKKWAVEQKIAGFPYGYYISTLQDKETEAKKDWNDAKAAESQLSQKLDRLEGERSFIGKVLKGVKFITLFLPRLFVIILFGLNIKNIAKLTWDRWQIAPEDKAKMLLRWDGFGGIKKEIETAVKEGAKKNPIWKSKDAPKTKLQATGNATDWDIDTFAADSWSEKKFNANDVDPLIAQATDAIKNEIGADAFKEAQDAKLNPSEALDLAKNTAADYKKEDGTKGKLIIAVEAAGQIVSAATAPEGTAAAESGTQIAVAILSVLPDNLFDAKNTNPDENGTIPDGEKNNEKGTSDNTTWWVVAGLAVVGAVITIFSLKKK